jgi:hypothetical protein
MREADALWLLPSDALISPPLYDSSKKYWKNLHTGLAQNVVLVPNTVFAVLLQIVHYL